MTAPSKDERMPTRWQAFAFGFKAGCFRLRRSLANFGRGPLRIPLAPIDDDVPVRSESRSLLYPNSLAAEFGLQAGKVQNLRIAARFLNGLAIPAGEVFSFWAQVPRPTRRQNFVEGRELREGCVIPSVGGGLCQLSNALYDAALKAGLEIVERHGHSRILPGSMAETGRDATVFWNYVDLRFRPANEVQLEVILGRGELIVRFRGRSPAERGNAKHDPVRQLVPAGEAAESCETCGVTSCFRHPEAMELPQSSVTAWLLQAYSPEHDQHVQSHRTDRDWAFVPLTSSKRRWTTSGFAQVRSFLPKPGDRPDESLAKAYEESLPFTATHLVISQDLLPFLWLSGALGGRTYDVLMVVNPPNLTDPCHLAAKQAALAEARHLIESVSVSTSS